MSWNGDRDGRKTERERALVCVMPAKEQGRRRRPWAPAFAGVTSRNQAALASLLFSMTNA
jgi:hypothetical protein